MRDRGTQPCKDYITSIPQLKACFISISFASPYIKQEKLVTVNIFQLVISRDADTQIYYSVE